MLVFDTVSNHAHCKSNIFPYESASRRLAAVRGYQFLKVETGLFNTIANLSG